MMAPLRADYLRSCPRVVNHPARTEQTESRRAHGTTQHVRTRLHLTGRLCWRASPLPHAANSHAPRLRLRRLHSDLLTMPATRWCMGPATWPRRARTYRDGRRATLVSGGALEAQEDRRHVWRHVGAGQARHGRGRPRERTRGRRRVWRVVGARVDAALRRGRRSQDVGVADDLGPGFAVRAGPGASTAVDRFTENCGTRDKMHP